MNTKQIEIHESALIRLMFEREELIMRRKFNRELIKKQRAIISELHGGKVDFLTKENEPQPQPQKIELPSATLDDVRDCLSTIKNKANADLARNLLKQYGAKLAADLDPKHYDDLCSKSVIVLNDYLKTKQMELL